MNMVRTLAAALLAAVLAIPSAYAEEQKQEGAGDGEWSSKYGMIFSVQNVFQNNSDAVLGDFSGGVGLQYNLAPQRALRLNVSLSRASQPTTTVETTDLTDGSTAEQFFVPGENTATTADDFTSEYDVGLGALYVMRLASSAIAPYLGFGGGIGYSQTSLKYEDDISSATTIENVDDVERDLSLNAQGVLGVEWRVHKSVALFAEYGLSLDVISYSSAKFEGSISSKANGALLAGSKTEGSATRFFNFDTGLGQGGQLGLVAFF